MVQALEAQSGDRPIKDPESAHASLIGEVIDYVKEHKTISAIAGLGIAAGAVYCTRVPLGRFLGKCGVSLFAAEEVLGAAVKERALAEEAIVTGTRTREAGGKPLLTALDDAVKAGKVKTAPEPWAYNQEHRAMLKDLPKGAADLKPAGETIETLETVTSTQTPEATDITKIAFPGLSNPTAINAAKHRFLTEK